MNEQKNRKIKLGLRSRLLIVFFAVLALFALLMRLVFSTVFFQGAYQQELRHITADVADRAQISFRSEAFRNAFAQKDIEACASELDFLRDYAQIRENDIWIVAAGTVMISYNAQKDALEFDEIPTRFHPMVDRIFSGKDVSNREYEGVWNRGMFGVGSPVYGADGGVVAAVITQVSNSIVAATTRSADTAVLLSSFVAMAVALLFAGHLCGTLTRPLTRMKAAAQTWVTADYSARTVVSRGDEIGALAAAMDVLAERLSRLKEEREQSEQARYRFFADVSHELKTPVAVLRGQLEMLRDGIVTEPDEVRACITDSLGETALLQRLVEDLLTLAKLESPEFQLLQEAVSLTDVLGDIRRSNRGRSEETGVALVFQSHDTVRSDCIICGDYTRIRQMLAIFIDNAFKATPRGGTIHIAIACEEAPVITIRDEGAGMREEELRHVFERYYTHYSKGGVGLGLPIAHQIALRHGATISITSTVGLGTTIVVRFAAQMRPEETQE